MKMGYKIHRKDWEKKKDYLSIEKPSEKSEVKKPTIMLNSGDNSSPWNPKHSDILAGDWHTVKDKKKTEK
jgi:hypothetical protein